MGLGIAIVLPFGLVFFASGLLINALQVISTAPKQSVMKDNHRVHF